MGLFFFHKSNIWVKIRLNAKNQLPACPGSGLKVCGGWVVVVVVMQISSSCAKILAETKFQPREFPQSGSKAEDVERRMTENQ